METQGGENEDKLKQGKDVKQSEVLCYCTGCHFTKSWGETTAVCMAGICACLIGTWAVCLGKRKEGNFIYLSSLSADFSLVHPKGVNSFARSGYII